MARMIPGQSLRDGGSRRGRPVRLRPAPGIKRYWRLFRFRYHLNFISVIVGVLFASERITFPLVERIAVLYVSFNVLLYGGIYTLNEIMDLESDRQHPMKRRRPLASGEIGLGGAFAFAAITLSSGLLIAYLCLGMGVFRLFLAFLLINAFYGTAVKRVPYVELAVNAATHPLRFVLGLQLAGGSIPVSFTVAYFFLAIGFASLRRVVEKDVEGWQSRRVLERYSGGSLFVLQLVSFAIILALSLIDRGTPKVWYAVIAVFYLFWVFGIYAFEPLRKPFRDSFTR